MPCAGGKVRSIRCGSVLGGELESQAVWVQVNHLVSWIPENCALGIFARLFFEVSKMKALQSRATPHCSRQGTPSRERRRLHLGVGVGQK